MGILARAKGWLGETLVFAGGRLLGVTAEIEREARAAILPPPPQPETDGGEYLPPIVTAEAERLIARPEPPRRESNDEPPLRGSLRARLAREKGSE